MLGWFQYGQLAFALFLSLVIGERVRALCLVAPTSDAGMRFLLEALRTSDDAALAAYCRARPRSHAGRIVALALRRGEEGEPLDELLSDLYAEAGARLALLRVCATLASTTGLLGGILALAREPEESGLFALQAGGALRANVGEALTTMALGVALSALCFYALALLRPEARRLVAEDARLAREVAFLGGATERER